MAESKEISYYEQELFWSAERYGDFERQRIEACISLLPENVASLVDVGAGNGLFLSVAETRRAFETVCGVERSRSAVEAALCEARIIQGSADSLPLAGCSVEIVAALDVVEHLPFGVYESALTELERVSSRYILINVPYREHRLQAMCPYCACMFNPHFHMRSFDRHSLGGLFRNFMPVKFREVHRPESVLAIVAKPFRRRVFGGWPGYAICPQCGFRAGEVSGSDRPASRKEAPFYIRLVKGVASAVPALPVATEIVVLYERVHPG